MGKLVFDRAGESYAYILDEDTKEVIGMLRRFMAEQITLKMTKQFEVYLLTLVDNRVDSFIKTHDFNVTMGVSHRLTKKLIADYCNWWNKRRKISCDSVVLVNSVAYKVKEMYTFMLCLENENSSRWASIDEVSLVQGISHDCAN